MQIVLLRHGKVNYPPIQILSAAGFSHWVNEYNSNGLDTASQPTPGAISIASQVNAVVCSDLPRSLESAQALQVNNVVLSDALFKEADLPVANWRFPLLSIRIWVIIFRLAWLFGYSSNSESFKEAKARAIKATLKLIELAEEHQSVLFVGHGLMNRFITSQLIKHGWKGPKTPGRKYWDYDVFTLK